MWNVYDRYCSGLPLVSHPIGATVVPVHIHRTVCAVCNMICWFGSPAICDICRYFRKCARELKRLEGSTKSPLVSNIQVPSLLVGPVVIFHTFCMLTWLFQATMQELVTIRAFNKTDAYSVENIKQCDTNSSAFFAYYTRSGDCA